MKNKGFTLIELMVVIVIIVLLFVVGFGIFGILKGNFWYSEDKVFQVLKTERPEITELISTQRHVFGKSIIKVRENGAVRIYYLDTNVLFSYSFSE
ncbi:MAG: prepilin-type N-terminal cleavage/methylation domain-containing protein [Candidatus Nanoarchaeia archaeon]|nr:prepilin-type N-terminal cleavage/methylation domain-containing protein [Candidatus Nanoarchaeia archaeon]